MACQFNNQVPLHIDISSFLPFFFLFFLFLLSSLKCMCTSVWVSMHVETADGYVTSCSHGESLSPSVLVILN